MAHFEIGDPVRIVTDRPLACFLRGNVRRRRPGLPLRARSYRGTQGFVCGMTLARDAPADSPPTGYHVTFYAPAELPAPDLPEETAVPWFPGDLPRPARLQVDKLRADDLEPNPAPPESWEQFWNRQGDEGEDDVDVLDLLIEADLLLDAKTAAENPEAFRATLRAGFPEWSEQSVELALENTRSGWPPEAYTHGESVANYLEAKTKWEGGLWTPDTEEAFEAIRATEAGDRALLDALLDSHSRFRPYPIVFPERAGLGDAEVAEVPTTACFDCDAIVPVTETWVNRKGLALCEGCFRAREVKGHARRGTESSEGD